MPVTKAICGKNVQEHAIAGGQGMAATAADAKRMAQDLFDKAKADADKSLRAYAAQPCPRCPDSPDGPPGCPTKTPPNPVPVYGPVTVHERHDPGAPAVPATPAVPARPSQPAAGGRPAIPGTPAIPAKPAVPARPAGFICTISQTGTVTFTCDGDCPDVQG